MTALHLFDHIAAAAVATRAMRRSRPHVASMFALAHLGLMVLSNVCDSSVQTQPVQLSAQTGLHLNNNAAWQQMSSNTSAWLATAVHSLSRVLRKRSKASACTCQAIAAASGWCTIQQTLNSQAQHSRSDAPDSAALAAAAVQHMRVCRTCSGCVRRFRRTARSWSPVVWHCGTSAAALSRWTRRWSRCAPAFESCVVGCLAMGA